MAQPGRGKGGGGGKDAETSLIVVFRDAATDKLRSDGLGPYVAEGTGIDRAAFVGRPALSARVERCWEQQWGSTARATLPEDRGPAPPGRSSRARGDPHERSIRTILPGAPALGANVDLSLTGRVADWGGEPPFTSAQDINAFLPHFSRPATRREMASVMSSLAMQTRDFPSSASANLRSKGGRSPTATTSFAMRATPTG